MTKFITIAGRKQVGKDTTARYIHALYNAHHNGGKIAHIAHFADVLKEACHLVFGIDRNLLFGTDEDKNTVTHIKWPYRDMSGVWSESIDNEKYMTVREVLQFVGTELFRNQIRSSVWTESVFRRKYDADLVIVADCRFRDEAKYSLKYGPLIKVVRPNNPSPASTHSSELEVDLIPEDYFRYVLMNDGPLESIETFARHVLLTEGLI